jgi:hypothetical protein
MKTGAAARSGVGSSGSHDRRANVTKDEIRIAAHLMHRSRYRGTEEHVTALVESAKAVDAGDPHAGSTGKPTTRVASSSSEAPPPAEEPR